MQKAPFPASRIAEQGALQRFGGGVDRGESVDHYPRMAHPAVAIDERMDSADTDRPNQHQRYELQAEADPDTRAIVD
jgi:hypothetical protein